MLARLGFSAQQLRYLYGVKIAAVLLMLVIGYRHYTELHRFRLSPMGTGIALLTGLAVFWLWIHLDAGWMQVGASAGFDPRTGGRIDWLLVAMRIAGAALVVPVMEELFWRAFLLRWIVDPHFDSVDTAQVTLKSIALTVVLFGFEHTLWFAGVLGSGLQPALPASAQPVVGHPGPRGDQCGAGRVDLAYPTLDVLVSVATSFNRLMNE